MNIEERIRITREKAESLHRLLLDPEPGLATWLTAVAEACDAIAEHAPSFERRKPQKPIITNIDDPVSLDEKAYDEARRRLIENFARDNISPAVATTLMLDVLSTISASEGPHAVLATLKVYLTMCEERSRMIASSPEKS